MHGLFGVFNPMENPKENKRKIKTVLQQSCAEQKNVWEMVEGEDSPTPLIFLVSDEKLLKHTKNKKSQHQINVSVVPFGPGKSLSSSGIRTTIMFW
jgi:hypothetical protein